MVPCCTARTLEVFFLLQLDFRDQSTALFHVEMWSFGQHKAKLAGDAPTAGARGLQHVNACHSEVRNLELCCTAPAAVKPWLELSYVVYTKTCSKFCNSLQLGDGLNHWCH